jgi:hypothetical protein
MSIYKNILPDSYNAGFDTGVTSGWLYLIYGGSFSVVSSPMYQGSYAFSFFSVANSSAIYTAGFPVLSGYTYETEAWYWCASGKTVSMQVRDLGTSGTTSVASGLSDGTWKSLVVTRTMTQASSIQIFLLPGSGSAVFDSLNVAVLDGGVATTDFESGSHDGWIATSGGISIVSSPVHGGMYSVCMSGGPQYLRTGTFSLSGDYTMTVDAYFFAQSGQWGKITLWDNVNSQSASNALMGNGAWQKLSATMQMSTSVASVQAFLYGGTSGTTEVYYDDYKLARWIDNRFDDGVISPKRLFYIGTSDYSDRVVKWPKVKQEAGAGQVIDTLESQSVSIQLANHDGHFNDFYKLVYNTQQQCILKMGFVNSDGDVESLPLYTGNLQLVRYPSEGIVELRTRDVLYDLTQRVVGGQSSLTLTYSLNPAWQAWRLCTSWGLLNPSWSYDNTDIDFTKWLSWCAQFSSDGTQETARFDGGKVIDYLQSVLRASDSTAYVDGSGKICFFRFSEASSRGTVFDRSNLKNMSIDVEALQVINQQIVNYNYSVTSDYFQGVVTIQSSTSVDSFGLKSDTIDDTDVWLCDSVSATNLAQRRVNRWQYPPVRFSNVGGLRGIYREIGETAWVVNSFYGVGSESGYRIVSKEVDMQDGSIKWELDEVITDTAFYLDITSLDGIEMLL